MAGSLIRTVAAIQSTRVWGWEDWVLTTDTDPMNIYMGDGVTVGGLLVGGVVPGASDTFLGLTDTPGSYSGQDGKYLTISGGAVVFSAPPAVGSTTFTGLTDTPGSIGADGTVLGVTSGAIVFKSLSLSSLSNVSSTAPLTGQFLGWNGSTWIPTTVVGGGGGASALTELSDFPSAYLAPGAALVVNSTNDGLVFTANRLGDLSNVASTTPTTGQILGWNGSTWLPVNAAAGTFVGLSDTPGSLGSNGTFLGVSGGILSFLTPALGDLSNVSPSAATTGQVLSWNGTNWAPSTPSSGVSTFLALTDTPGSLGANGTVLGVASGSLSFLTQNLSTLADVTTTGRGVGSVMFYNGSTNVFTGAPANNQGLKFDTGTNTWVFEDVLLVDLNLSPSQVTVVDGYAPGTLLMADDEGDSYNALPPGSNGQFFKIIAGMPTWVTDAANGGIYSYASRAAAVADTAAWASASFPCLLLLEGEVLGGTALDIGSSGASTPTTGTPVQKSSVAGPQVWMLTAAPTTPRTPASEIEVSGRIIDDNGEWATETHPFPIDTHPWSNFLSRSAPKFLTALPGTGANARELWLPKAGELGRFTIPAAQVVTGITTAAFLASTYGLVTRWRMQVVGGLAASAIEGALYLSNKAVNMSGHITIATGQSNQQGEGLTHFLDGALPTSGLGDPGLIQKGSSINVQFYTTTDNTHDIQVTLYGYSLDSEYPLV